MTEIKALVLEEHDELLTELADLADMPKAQLVGQILLDADWDAIEAMRDRLLERDEYRRRGIVDGSLIEVSVLAN